ncbi:Uu.00g125150.m01.CDS01 [Anthostomella pinea]|uniref:Uu.00g125150.m01.CDS01 n=1 Tax=Anthostomella pinea TaxID=933095 RepID=A0AAI8VI97_9PEZI|nr:Uu.00g125150.m01.CDS01 [Anthostomella pinea]
MIVSKLLLIAGLIAHVTPSPTSIDTRSNSVNLSPIVSRDEMPEELKSLFHAMAKKSGDPISEDDMEDRVLAARSESIMMGERNSYFMSYAFLTPTIPGLPWYEDDVLGRLRGNDEQSLLDVGSGPLPDLHWLLKDGVTKEKLFGTDLKGEFFAMGKKAFGKSHLDDDQLYGGVDLTKLDLIKGSKLDNHRFSIVYASRLFHLFRKDKEQKDIAANLLYMLAKKQKGAAALITGWTMAEAQLSGPWAAATHNEKSWEKLWDDAKDGYTGDGEIARIDTYISVQEPAQGSFKVLVTFED